MVISSNSFYNELSVGPSRAPETIPTSQHVYRGDSPSFRHQWCGKVFCNYPGLAALNIMGLHSAQARGISWEAARGIAKYTNGRFLGILWEKVVNMLEVNMATLRKKIGRTGRIPAISGPEWESGIKWTGCRRYAGLKETFSRLRAGE